MSVPSKGDFGWATLAGGRDVRPDEFLDDRHYFGLEREAGYLWGTLRDEAGSPLTFMRRLPDPSATDTVGGSSGSLGDKLVLQSSWDDAGALRIRREARVAPPAQELRRRLDGDDFVVEADTPDVMQLRLGQADASWFERDLLDVSGPTAGPGLQWYLPGRDAAIYYPSSTWHVTGTALGRPVTGFLFYEEAYVPPGGRLYVQHDPLLGDELHTTWYSWATQWDDGTLEYGHFLFGHDRFDIAVIGSSDGSVRVPREREAVITRNEDGYWADRIDYVLDGEEWEFLAADDGRMVDLGPIPNPQQEGLMRRKGETRTPVTWMAWGETVPGHGERRRVRRGLHPINQTTDREESTP